MGELGNPCGALAPENSELAAAINSQRLEKAAQLTVQKYMAKANVFFNAAKADSIYVGPEFSYLRTCKWQIEGSRFLIAVPWGNLAKLGPPDWQPQTLGTMLVALSSKVSRCGYVFPQRSSTGEGGKTSVDGNWPRGM